MSPPLTAASTAADPTGTWALRAGETVIMLFHVSRMKGGLSAEYTRPKNFILDGETFTHVSGPAVTYRAREIREVPGGAELIFDDPRPDATPDMFVLKPSSPETAELSYIGFGHEAAVIVRCFGRTELGPWDEQRTYVRQLNRPTDPEMTMMFEADQAARLPQNGIRPTLVHGEDKKRRMRTQALLDTGRLRSGEDFYHAAFIFQHGETPADYIKAHALAVIAAARGKSAAVWVAAASLDRYLQAIGQPQIFGTQLSAKGDWSIQDPYDPDLLSDAIRAASGVPTGADLALLRERYTNLLGK